ncbi:MAG: alpha-amylase family glycosyl hydrolase, partial [Candidatus Bathyarchaeia archaeon]
DDIRPLKVLDIFANKYLKDKFNTIHILPIFEYDSDRGFSIINYNKIDSNQGNWTDITDLKENFKLMFDLILNHISDKHIWFQEFLKNNPKYEKYFIWFTKEDLPSKDEIKKVFRPRTNPLFKKYNTIKGERYVWTTFPLNQVDLNYKNEEVLIEIINVMLYYILKGANIIRLDAVAYIWKQLGTNCLHLKPVHLIVQLLRAILDKVAPKVAIITETNVPHEENIQYFGDGRNEAQLVYNFALPPLVLFSLQTGSSKKISKWADKIVVTSDHTAFLNFLDSHDGIGLLGIKGILTEKEIGNMLERCCSNGGLISYNKNADGTETPYEINITWWNALNPPLSNDNLEIQISRYLASRAIPLCLKGISGTYFNGLIGALNDLEGATFTGNNRDINRKNLKLNEIEDLIADSDSRLSKVFHGYTKLIRNRIKEKSFHPNSLQEILFLNDHVFALRRITKDNNSSIIALHNLTKDKQSVVLNNKLHYDIISNKQHGYKILMDPYQVLWLKH